MKIRAAQIGIEYEKPRLAVTAVVEDRRFAALLDQRLQRIRESKLIEAQPINEGCIEKVEEGSKLVTDLTLAPAILIDVSEEGPRPPDEFLRTPYR